MSESTRATKKPEIQQTVLSSKGPFNADLAAYMRRHSLTRLEEFAQHSGIGATTLYNLVLGKKTASGTTVKPSVDTLRRLADTLQIPMHELVYKIEPDAYGSGLLLSTGHQAAVQVPVRVAGWVGAGPTQLTSEESHIYVEEAFAAGRQLVAFKIFGDSMEGGKRPIMDGDIVVVNQLDKTLVGTLVARVHGDGYVCKKPLVDHQGQLQQLVSTNLDYSDPDFRVIDRARIDEIVGRVVRVIHDVA